MHPRALLALASVPLAACTLLTSTDGLSGGSSPAADTPDAALLGASDASGASDAPATVPDAKDDAATEAGAAEAGPPPTDCAHVAGCTVLAQNQDTPTELLVVGNVVYWIRATAHGSVMRLPIGGGTPVATNNGNDVDHPHDLVYSDTYPWAADANGEFQRYDPGSSCSNAGGITRMVALARKPLAFARAGAITVGGCETLDAVVAAETAAALAADGAMLWWSRTNGDIVGCPAANCTTPTPLATGQGTVSEPEADDTHLYWTAAGSEIRSRAKAAAGTDGAPSVVATGQASPWVLRPDGATLFWTNLDDGTLMKVALTAGATPTVVLSGLDHPKGLAVTTKYVLVTESGAGRVLRLTR